MEFREPVEAGMTREETFRVEEEQSALTVGSGDSRVLATPWMIAFMERISHRLLAERLLPGYSSVGVVVDVRHLAPTPIGSDVRVRSEVIEVDGLRIMFKVEAFDYMDKVGEGIHQRNVVDEKRFLKRVDAKRAGDPRKRQVPLEEED